MTQSDGQTAAAGRQPPWVCFRRARRFAQTPSDFPVSGWQVCLDGKDAPYLMVSGVDMMDHTPVYDIKPYLAYTDSHADAVCGFADTVMDHELLGCDSRNLKQKCRRKSGQGLSVF